MPDPAKRATGIIRGVIDRVSDLEQSVTTDQGIPNLLRSVSEEMELNDSVSTSTQSAGAAQYDQDNYDQARYQ